MDRTLPAKENAGSISPGAKMRPTHASGDYIFVAHGNRKRAQGPVQQNGSREQGRAEKVLTKTFERLAELPAGAQNR